MSASYQEAAALFKPWPRAILFDAGFTLTFQDGARIAAYAAQAGLTLDPHALERAERALRAELREKEGVILRTHADKPDGWLTAVFRKLLVLAEVQASDDLLDRAAAAILERHLAVNAWSRVGAGVRESLARLRENGLRLGVVSNSEGTVEAMLIETGLRDLFDVVVDSAVVGVSKPDPRIFHLALEHLGIAASDAVMVGDSPSADIGGAEAAGVRAALLDPYDFYPWSRAPRFEDVAALTEALLASRI
ncbi:MAG TPA: HAD-IA family hydrolase [Polyangia bacterium]|nr:HAD-IA family hydrolase [Polyangia bacterium]